MNTNKHPDHTELQIKSDNKIVSKKTVAKTFFGRLLLALLITWCVLLFPPMAFLWIHLFPSGILMQEGTTPLYYGYAIYVTIFLIAFVFRNKHFFKILLLIYTLILCINIVGCRLLVTEIIRGIH